jgi:imidazolonepropionase-like amidohydrolase
MTAGGPLRILAAGLAGATMGAGGETGQGASPSAVLIQDGRIAALGQAALAAEAAEELDLRPAWLTPAPLDAHLHLWLRGEPAGNLAACLAAGLAAVRDLGNPPARQTPCGAADQPPLVKASGPGLCATGAAQTWLGIPCQGTEAFAAAARKRIKAGADVVKVFATGLLSFERPGEVEHPLAMSREELGAVTQVAHEAGLKVAAHTSGETSARACLAAGVDSLEHGFFLSRETLAMMAAKGTAWSPTLAAVEVHAADPEGRHDQATKENLRRIAASQAEALRLAEELGVNLVMGTDAGSYGLPHGQAVFMEMESWLNAGLTPRIIFEAATSRAAKAMGLSGELGVIEPGARAWLLATEHDPLQDPLTMQKPLWRSF